MTRQAAPLPPGPPPASQRAARLFRSVVASSGLLLAHCGGVVVAASDRDAERDTQTPSNRSDAAPAVDRVVPSSDDVAVTPSVDAALADTPLVDAALADTPLVDAALVDAALVDAALVDAALVDAALVDAALVDAALVDVRSQELGWPTTKGTFCWTTDAGSPLCCRSSERDFWRGCCIPTASVCIPCSHDDAGVCTPLDVGAGERP